MPPVCLSQPKSNSVAFRGEFKHVRAAVWAGLTYDQSAFFQGIDTLRDSPLISSQSPRNFRYGTTTHEPNRPEHLLFCNSYALIRSRFGPTFVNSVPQ